MRLVIDSLIALMMVLILGGIILHHRQQEQLLSDYRTAHLELSQIREMVIYHTALDRDTLNEWGYPGAIDPAWFLQGLPFNRLVAGIHPWIDLAPPGDMNDQPPDPVVKRSDQAGYWYNPNRGIVRARVDEQFTEEATLALYNQINSTMLVSLPCSKNPARKPVPAPLLSPSQRASSDASHAEAGGSRAHTLIPETLRSAPSLRDLPAGLSLRDFTPGGADDSPSTMTAPSETY
jgi:hypothetical protein